MKGYSECIECHHQWASVTFDTIHCPACGKHGLERAVLGTRTKPDWFTGDDEPIELKRYREELERKP